MQLPEISDKCAADFPNCGAILPAPHTDFIYAVIVNELGLFGGAAVVLIYALITERGFKTAILAEDGFSKLLATGLTTIIALQAFVIIGGVTRVIPLTGVTLPFISYGGSSIVANFILLALLLSISDKARRRARREHEAAEARVRMNPQIVKLFGVILVLYALLFGFTSYWSIFDAEGLEKNVANQRPLLEEQRIERGEILAADGSVIATSKPRGRGRRPDLRPRLPGGRPLREPDRLQLRRAGPGRLRALPQRRAGRRQDRVPLDPRRAPGRGPGGLGRADGARPRRPGDGGRRAGRPEGLGRRDRPAVRRGADDGQHSRPTTRTRSPARTRFSG